WCLANGRTSSRADGGSPTARQPGPAWSRRARESGAAVAEEVADEGPPLLGPLDERQMPGRDLGVARPGDGVGELPVVVRGDELVERGGDDEGRHGDRGEVGPYVGVVDEQVEVIR